MDAFDAFAPPRSAPGPTHVGRPAGPLPQERRPERADRGRVAAERVAAERAAAERAAAERAAAVASLGTGLAAVAVAGVGSLAALSLGPAFVAALLGAVSLSLGGMALSRSRGRPLDIALLSAAGGVCTLVAAGITVVTLLFPFGVPSSDDVALPASGGARVPDEVLADLHARALPLGRATPMDGRDIAVAAVRTDPADVAARLDELVWLADDVGGLQDVVLVELDAPVDGGGWAPVVDSGDVTVVTPQGRPHAVLLTRGSVTYDVERLVEPSADGRPRGRVVVAISMAPASAKGGMVVVTSPSWTDVAAWSVPAW